MVNSKRRIDVSQSLDTGDMSIGLNEYRHWMNSPSFTDFTYNMTFNQPYNNRRDELLSEIFYDSVFSKDEDIEFENSKLLLNFNTINRIVQNLVNRQNTAITILAGGGVALPAGASLVVSDLHINMYIQTDPVLRAAA